MKQVFAILKDGIHAIKSQRALRKTVFFLWVFYLSYYLVNMLSPLFQSALLDGAVNIFSGNSGLGLLAGGMGGILFAGCVLALYQAKVNPLHTKADSEIGIAIQSKIYDKLCRIPYSAFNSPKIYETIGVISGKYASYCSGFLAGQTLSSLVGTLVSFVFTAVVLVRISPLIALIMIGGNLFGIFKTWLESRLNYYAVVENMKDRRYAGSYGGALFDRHTIKEVKIYGLADYLTGKWYRYTSRVNRKTVGYNLLFVLLDLATYFTANLFTVTALILTAKMILEGSLSVGAFVLVYSSSGSLIDTSGSLFGALRDLKLASYYASKYREFLSLPDVEPNRTVLEKLQKYETPLEIRFKNVSFTYEGSKEKALDGVNLTIHEGEKIAIVGENGCGKSTLVALLNRLYAPDEGEIEISGLPQETQLPRLRREVTTVFQDFGRYETSFRENIEMGERKPTRDDGHLWDCARKAGIDTRILQSPRGLDTPIGRFASGGINLSGGEWQKLAVARGLARSSTKLLVLDEPNASLDPISEADLYKRVFDAMAGQSLVLITHRLGAVKYVNRIVVMDHGRIIEDGSHEDLMKAGGKYTEMYRAQEKWYVT